MFYLSILLPHTKFYKAQQSEIPTTIMCKLHQPIIVGSFEKKNKKTLMWSHVKIDMQRSHFPSHVYMTRQNDQIEGEIQRPTKKRNSTIPTWLTFQIYALIHVGVFSTLHVARVERCKPIHKFHKHVSPTTQSHDQTHPTTMKNVIEVKISSICKSLNIFRMASI